MFWIDREAVEKIIKEKNIELYPEFKHYYIDLGHCPESRADEFAKILGVNVEDIRRE